MSAACGRCAPDRASQRLEAATYILPSSQLSRLRAFSRESFDVSSPFCAHINSPLHTLCFHRPPCSTFPPYSTTRFNEKLGGGKNKSCQVGRAATVKKICLRCGHRSSSLTTVSTCELPFCVHPADNYVLRDARTVSARQTRGAMYKIEK